MGADFFPGLHDDTRLWVIVLDPPSGSGSFLEELGTLLGQWRHKGHAYQAAWEFLDGRLLLVAEPAMATEPSGCAIDGMLRKVAALAGRHGMQVLEEDRVLAKVAGAWRSFGRAELEARLADGTLRGDTPVLDRSLHHLGQLREGGLERPLARTWIGRKHRDRVGA